MLDYFGKRRETSVMHVGRGHFNIPQRGHLELPKVACAACHSAKSLIDDWILQPSILNPSAYKIWSLMTTGTTSNSIEKLTSKKLFRGKIGEVGRLAESDIEDILDYIAADNPDAALHFYEEFLVLFEKVGASPKIGHQRKELGSNLRSLPFGNYVIFFEGEAPVEIIRVLYGSRDVDSII